LLKKELLEPLPRPKKERVPSSSEVSRWRSRSRWLRRRSLLWPSLSSSSPPKMEAAMPLMPAPMPPALEREERWRERERERLRSLWEWRLLRCDLDRFECEVWAEMTEPASSKMPMAAAV
jgi:hypothetical protein